MSARYVNVDRDTAMLLPVDLREWVRGDDLAHFILEAVEGVDTCRAAVNARGTGSAQYPPGMMLAVLLYAYAHGIFSSRRIEAATYTHLSLRFLAGNTHPDHDTIATFRRVNRALISGCFVRVLELARELGLLQVGAVAVDGTKLWANAAKRSTLTKVQLEAKERELWAEEVEGLLQKAEGADAQEDAARRAEDGATALPRELADRAQRRARLEAARLALEQKAQARAEVAQSERERAQTQGVGPAPRVEPARVRESDTVNLSDPQSGLQPTAREGFIQGYNAQAAVCAQSGLVLAARVVTDTSDRRQLAPTVAAIPASAGQPTAVLADRGYDNAAHILEVERTTGATVYCALQPPRPKTRGRAQTAGTAGPKSESRTRQGWQAAHRQRREQMAKRLASEEGRRQYGRRQTSVEPTFGMIKSVLGFRRFGLRGLAGVNLEWQLVGAAFNCRRLASRRQNRSPR